MSKVLTFSRAFPAYHPKKGERTYFVEAILNSIGVKVQGDLLPGVREIVNDFFMLDGEHQKHHTIRAGKRWKVGDYFSPRVWSGKPYCSKQIIIAPDIELKKVWDIHIDENGVIDINGQYLFYDLDENEMPTYKRLANNDGLTEDEFNEWLVMPCFRKGKTFDGQILCWNDKINY